MIDATLADRSPDDRRAIYRSMIEVLACLHMVDWRASASSNYGKPGNYIARQCIAGRRSIARRKQSGLTPWSV